MPQSSAKRQTASTGFSFSARATPTQALRTVLASTLGTCLAGVSAGAIAQAVDAGRVYDSLQQRQPRVVQPQAPSVKLAPSPAATAQMPSAATQLDVKAFRIEGAQRLALPKLEAIVQPYAGKSLSVSQLQEVADAVAQAYRDLGYTLTQAAVLPQTIQDGVVTITVREGQLERLELAAAPSPRGTPGVAQTGLQSTLRLGEPVNTRELEQTLLLINNLPGGGRASAEIAPGAQADSAVVSASYAAAPRLSGQVVADSHGNRFTGRWRAHIGAALAEPFSAGDQFSVYGLTSGRHLQYVQGGYRVPLGLRAGLGLSASKLRYELCCQAPGQASKGDAQTLSLEANYQALLGRGLSLVWFAGLDAREFESRRTGLAPSNRDVDALSAGARGYWVGTAQNSWGISARGGKVDLGATDLAADAAGARTDGPFSKLSANYWRLQPLGGAWSAQLWVRAQANLGRNLESSERFVLGGADGVRGYPSGEGLGDSGWLASAELRYAAAALPGLAVSGFVDAGGIKRYSKNEAALAGALPNRYELGGWGMGLRYDVASANVQLSVARPIGSNRGADAAGKNNEGQKDGARAWLSAAWRF